MDNSNNDWELQEEDSPQNVEYEESGQFSGRVKIDLKTPLELLFFIGSILSGVVVFIGVVIFLTEGNNVGKEILKVSLTVFVITLLCYLKTDNYYILDCDEKHLLYHFKFFGYEKLSNFAHFNEIHAVTVEGQFRQTKHSSWWEYRTVIVLASKKLIPISDFERDGHLMKTGFLVQKKRAEDFANITGAALVEPEREKTVKIKLGLDGKYTFELKPISFLDNLWILAIVVVTVTVMIILLTLALTYFK